MSIYTFEVCRTLKPKRKLDYPLPYYVRRALGLKPWDEFAREVVAKKNPVFDFSRLYSGMGKTTKMIVQAVYWSQNREVYLVGYNQRYTNMLIQQAKHYCYQLGLGTQNIKGFNQDAQLTGRRFEKGSLIFVDHYCHKDPKGEFISRIRD